MPEYISKEKKILLEDELKFLITKKRREILSAVESAKALGDLSENAEYHEARNEQRRLEERISQVEQILKNSIVASRTGTSRVEVGATVIVKKTGDSNNRTFEIVGAEEADMASGKLSHKSPLGL